MQKLDRLTDTGLSEAHLDLLQSVFEATEWLEEAILFGSRAKGTAAPESDIDIACTGTRDSLEVARLADALEDLPLPYQFDVVGLESLEDAPLLDHIRRVGIRLYKRSAA
jgi:predicted nucleotidyltransferase